MVESFEKPSVRRRPVIEDAACVALVGCVHSSGCAAAGKRRLDADHRSDKCQNA